MAQKRYCHMDIRDIRLEEGALRVDHLGHLNITHMSWIRACTYDLLQQRQRAKAASYSMVRTSALPW